jgi:hypothetical protein
VILPPKRFSTLFSHDPESTNVYCLKDVYAIPLTSTGAPELHRQIQLLQAKRVARSRFKWNIPFAGLNIRGAGAVPSPEPELQNIQESDEGLDTDSESETAPEADEDLPRVEKGLSSNWARWNFLKTPKPSHNDIIQSLQSGTPEPTDVPPLLPPPSPSSQPAIPAEPSRPDLESKIVRQVMQEFTSGGFFYSFDHDLTHTVQQKQRLSSSRAASNAALSSLLATPAKPNPPRSEIDSFLESPNIGSLSSSRHGSDITSLSPSELLHPLWRRVDRRFFWNEHLMKDFIEQEFHSYILPVMQGWIQSTTFDVSLDNGEVVPVDLTVVSRRSKDRAGLRYQRRGIDGDGHVANFVETEMMIRTEVGYARCP